MSQIFATGNDDYMFPTTQAGLRQSGMILESVNGSRKEDEQGVLENAIDEYATASKRIDAMSAVLTWIEEGEYNYNALDETIVAVADLDGDFEITEAEEALYSDIWNEVPNALLTLGAVAADVEELVNGPNDAADKAAARIGKILSEKMDEEEADDDSLIAGFAFGEDAILESASYDASLHGILEATYKRMRVVRDGKKEIINKRISGKVRMTAAERLSLKKAQRKAHTASANLARKKSMRKRQNMGL